MSEIEESWKTTLYNHPINQTIRQFLSKFPIRLTKPIHKKRELDYPTLYIWGSGWSSSSEVSFDCDCLKWQAILKFTDVNFDVKCANEPLMSPSKKLPFLALENGEVLVDDNLELYIEQKSEEHNKLSQEQKAQSAAYIATADTKLRNALLFNMWCEPINQEITFYKYASHYPWPLNKILFHQAAKNVTDEILTRSEVLDRDQIYEEAADALSALSTELNDSNYFFGSRSPTMLDAIVFSYIYSIISLAGSSSSSFSSSSSSLNNNNELYKLVIRHENLVDFSKRIHENYFTIDI